MEACTLCGGSILVRVAPKGDRRSYYHCHECHLIFADRRFHLSPEEERSRYLFHKNGLHDEGYVRFLDGVIAPTLTLIKKGMRGLDYGCGPEPTLSKLVSARGFECFDYDPLFGFGHPHSSYDFIFATECFEHFKSPSQEFRKIDALLPAGGILSVLTGMWDTLEGFGTWWYKRDLTHVSFFHRNTFAYLCREFNYGLRYTDNKRLVILEK